MKFTYLYFLMLLLITSSCEKLYDKDHSLTAEEYKNLGMPDFLRVWSFEDYNEACGVLDDIKYAKPLSLPKKTSKRSGMYFDRIINLDNLDFLLEDTLSLQQKAHIIQPYVNIHKHLLRIYTDLHTREQYYNKELIDLYIFGLTITQNMLDIGFQINESIDEEDIKMQSGFLSIQYKHLNMILYVLGIQEKSTTFEKSDLERLTDLVSSSILINKDWMEPAAVEDLKLKLQKVIDNSSSEYIIEKYNSVIESF